MTKFLDLRKKIEPQVQVVYKIVSKQQPWYLEITKILVVIAIVTTVVWGVSKAQQDTQTAPTPEVKTFSVIGLVSTTTPTYFSIDSSDPAVDKPATSYTFDTGSIQKIETSDYLPLQFSDIKLGDKIIVDGVVDNYKMIAQHIVSFTSTPSVDNLASTTPEVATSTVVDTASSTASSSPSVIENVVNTIKDTAQNIIDSIIGTTIGTTTPEATTTDETSTTTDQVETPATSTEILPVAPPTTPPSTDNPDTNNASST